MNDMRSVLLTVVIVFFLTGTGPACQDKPATPAEQYQALAREFNEVARGLYLATTDEQRKKVAESAVPLPAKFLELAEKHPADPVALDALVQVVNQEIWLVNNTSHPGWGKDSLEGKAISLMLRDYVESDRIGEATRRVQYGFRKECETFLRTVLDKNPHKEIRALACLRLGQFLMARLQRLGLIRERPDMAKRYEGLFGKDYLRALLRQGRAKATREAESFFQQAAEDYGDVKLPFGGMVGEKAKLELYEIHHLSIGSVAQEIEGEDQDGKRFKLSDYRGKVVLLYFWSEY